MKKPTKTPLRTTPGEARLGKYSKLGPIDFSRTEDVQRLYSRLSAQTEISSSGCFLWMGSTDTSGYGRLKVNGRIRPLHRLSYTAFIGIPRDGNIVRHKCDVRRCWNPSHLEEGTHRDNAIDCIVRGRHASGRTELVNRKEITKRRIGLPMVCRNGHPRTVENTRLSRIGARMCVECKRANYRRARVRMTELRNQPDRK